MIRILSAEIEKEYWKGGDVVLTFRNEKHQWEGSASTPKEHQQSDSEQQEAGRFAREEHSLIKLCRTWTIYQIHAFISTLV